jgi:hypothetical protein
MAVFHLAFILLSEQRLNIECLMGQSYSDKQIFSEHSFLFDWNLQRLLNSRRNFYFWMLLLLLGITLVTSSIDFSNLDQILMERLPQKWEIWVRNLGLSAHC